MSRQGKNSSSSENVVSDFAMDSYPADKENEIVYPSNLVVRTSWKRSSCEEAETGLVALSSMLLATAIAVRNVCGEGGSPLSSGEANLEPIGNLKL